MPCAPSACDARSMNGWFMPAPAPCAKTYTYRASVAKELVQAFEETHELGLYLEDLDAGIVAQLFEALASVLDRPVAVVEFGIDLVPFDRHRYGCARRRAHAVRRDHQLAGAILERVDVDLPFPLADRALRRRDVGMPVGDEPGEQDRELERLGVGHLPPERQHEVEP